MFIPCQSDVLTSTLRTGNLPANLTRFEMLLKTLGTYLPGAEIIGTSRVPSRKGAPERARMRSYLH